MKYLITDVQYNNNLISSMFAHVKNTYCTLLVSTPPIMPLMTLLPLPTIFSTISSIFVRGGGGGPPPKCQFNDYLTNNSYCMLLHNLRLIICQY